MSDLPVEPQVADGVQIQPAMHFTPGPVTINVTENPTPDGGKFIILHIEHSAGSTFVALNPDFAKAIGEKLIERGSGITIARAESRIIRGR